MVKNHKDQCSFVKKVSFSEDIINLFYSLKSIFWKLNKLLHEDIFHVLRKPIFTETSVTRFNYFSILAVFRSFLISRIKEVVMYKVAVDLDEDEGNLSKVSINCVTFFLNCSTKKIRDAATLQHDNHIFHESLWNK